MKEIDQVLWRRYLKNYFKETPLNILNKCFQRCSVQITVLCGSSTMSAVLQMTCSAAIN
jgi:hypothetical protein